MTFHVLPNGCTFAVYQDGTCRGRVASRDEATLLVQILTAMEEAKRTLAQS